MSGRQLISARLPGVGGCWILFLRLIVSATKPAGTMFELRDTWCLGVVGERFVRLLIKAIIAYRKATSTSSALLETAGTIPAVSLAIGSESILETLSLDSENGDT